MTRYLLEFCFDPSKGLTHANAFADFCLRPSPFSFNVDAPLKAVTDLLGEDAIADFWDRSGEQIKKQLASATCAVFDYKDFKMTYNDWLSTLFSALDQLASVRDDLSTQGQ